MWNNRKKYEKHTYRDTEKRKHLDKAMAYLSKDEQHIDSLSDKKERSFVRGTLTKSKGNMGRPRKDLL